MATVRENLIAAKALIDTPEKWVKGAFVRNGCYCALGAMGKIEAGYASHFSSAGAHALWECLPHRRSSYADMSVAEFNDAPSTTHADIMALFDRAIAAQEAERHAAEIVAKAEGW